MKVKDTDIGMIVELLLEREANGRRAADYGRALKDVLDLYSRGLKELEKLLS